MTRSKLTSSAIGAALLLGLLGGRLSAPRPVEPQVALVEPAPVPARLPVAEVVVAPAPAAASVLPWIHGHEEDPELVALDPAGVTAALERFRTTTDAREMDDLIGLLGQCREERVEVAALDLAWRGECPARRAAAFDLLDLLDLPATLPLVLRALVEEDDPDVRCSALYALPRPEGVRAEQLGEVGVRLRAVLQNDPQAETRRRAALALGDWHEAPAAVPALTLALSSDPSPEVRAGCAFALEQARPRDPAARGVLVQVVRDAGEDPLVRENAWHALGAAAPLDGAEHAAWLAFAQARGLRSGTY